MSDGNLYFNIDLVTELQSKEYMSYPADDFSIEMSSFQVTGNTIDHTWSKFILRENGTVDPVAKDMLGEIVYWYRPQIERNFDTGDIVVLKKYKADLLQISYAQLEIRLGYTKRQLEEGFKTLERVGVAQRVFRTIVAQGQKISNVLFIRLNPKKLSELREIELKKSDTYHVKTGHPSTLNATPPTLKRDTNTETTQRPPLCLKQGNEEGVEKTMPSSKKRSKTKYPLKKNQLPLFDWLKSQEIDSDDDTLIYYIRTYPEQKIRDAIGFMGRENEKGAKIGSRGAFLRRVLDGTITMQNANSDENKGIAKAFMELTQWSSLVITEKYIRDEVTGDDVYFHLPKEEFEKQLDKLHKKSQMYQ